MLKVDRQTGGFTPHAPLNRVPFGCSTGVETLEHSPSIPVDPSWQNSCNLSYTTCPPEFLPAVILAGWRIPLGPDP